MIIINCFSICFSYSLLHRTFAEEKKLVPFLINMFICVLVYMLFYFLKAENFTLLPMGIVVSIVNKSNKTSIKKALIIPLTSIIFLTLYVMMLGILFMIFAPVFMKTEIYNIVMSALIIGFSIVVWHFCKDKTILNKISDSDKTLLFTVLIELVILVFMSVILPLAMKSGNNFTLNSIYYLFIVTLIVTVFFILFYLNQIEAFNRNEELKVKFNEFSNRNITQKYNDIIFLNHYYKKLYDKIYIYIQEEKWLELREYYENHITPLHEKFILQGDFKCQAELVKISLIRKLLINATVRAEHIYKIKLDLHIDGVVEKINILEIDLFIILNEWIENAFDHVVESKRSISFIIVTDFEKTMIKIENALINSVDIKGLTTQGFTTKTGHTGMGLTSVDKILSNYKNVEHMTYIECGKFTQYLVVYD